MNTDDPIIAAIEAHRQACAETCAAYEHQNAVEHELATGVRVPAGEAENDLQWIAANDAAGEALAVQDDLALKLLETQPTTVAGAAALLTYYVDAVTTTQPEVFFPNSMGMGDHSSPGRSMSRGILLILSSATSPRHSAIWLLRVMLLNSTGPANY